MCILQTAPCGTKQCLDTLDRQSAGSGDISPGLPWRSHYRNPVGSAPDGGPETGDTLKERVAREWNKDIYCHIEKQWLRRTAARQKLAGVNAEFLKQRIQAFLGLPVQGIGRVKGTAVLVSSITEMPSYWRVWYKGYLDAKNQCSSRVAPGYAEILWRSLPA